MISVELIDNSLISILIFNIFATNMDHLYEPSQEFGLLHYYYFSLYYLEMPH